MIAARIALPLASVWCPCRRQPSPRMAMAYRCTRAILRAWKLKRRAERAAQRGRFARAVRLGKRAEAAFLRAYVIAWRVRA
jgi:hypothetical protein